VVRSITGTPASRAHISYHPYPTAIGESAQALHQPPRTETGAICFLRILEALPFSIRVYVNKLNTAGTVQIGQRFETLADRAQATW